MPVLKQRRVTIKLIEQAPPTTEVQAQEVRQEVIVHHLQQNRVLGQVLQQEAVAAATAVVEVLPEAVRHIQAVPVVQEALAPAVVQEVAQGVVHVQVHHLRVEDKKRVLPKININKNYFCHETKRDI